MGLKAAHRDSIGSAPYDIQAYRPLGEHNCPNAAWIMLPDFRASLRTHGAFADEDESLLGKTFTRSLKHIRMPAAVCLRNLLRKKLTTEKSFVAENGVVFEILDGGIWLND